jgi:beta-lactamase regulating signal transducer with metallopeptidase domain
MTTLFLKVLDMSLIGSYVILGILVLRLLFVKAPKIVSYLLWIVAFLRLLIPFSITGTFSLTGLFNKELPVPSTVLAQLTTPVEQTLPIGGGNPQPGAEIAVEWASSVGYADIAAAFWIAGAVALLLYATVSLWKLLTRLRFAIKVDADVYETDRIHSPFVLGFLRPRIYLPTGLSEVERDAVLRHERIHIRRKDHIVKLVAFCGLAVHWFNPLVWLGYFLMTKDMEMSCDEGVMSRSEDDMRARYSRSLLALSTKQSGLVNPLAFGETNVKSRIKNVISYKKPKTAILLLVLIVAIAAAVLLLTDPPKSGSYENEYYGFSLELPSAFADQITIKEQGSVIFFVSNEMAEAVPEQIFGVVGRIEVYSKEQMSDEGLQQLKDAYNFRLLGENSRYYIGSAHATDVQTVPGAAEQAVSDFRALEAEFDAMLSSLKLFEAEGMNFLGFIKEVNTETGTIILDPVEWITVESTERIEELGLNQNDFPNGFYIYDPDDMLVTLKVDDATQIEVLNWNDLSVPMTADIGELAALVSDHEVLFHVQSIRDKAIRMWEQYRP